MNDDETLFEKFFSLHELQEKGVFGGGKPAKALLKSEFQKKVLVQAKDIAQRFKTYPQVEKIYMGGSVIKQRLGKYQEKWGIREYSDIDLFVKQRKKRIILCYHGSR